MKRTLLFLLVILLIVNGVAFSQTKSDSDESKTLNFHLKVNHTTNSLYLGRSDSIQTPFYGVEFGIAHKSGLYLNGGLQYYPGRVENKIDEYLLTGGYNFNIVKDKFTGGISYSRTFYNEYSTQVTSEIQGVFTGELNLDLNVFRAGISGVLNTGESTDFLISPSIGHDFSIEKFLGGHMVIGPTITITSGSQKLFALYKAKRTFKLKREKVKGTLKTDPAYSAFKVQDVSLTMPVSFTIKQFVVTITPAYDIPQNTSSGDFTSYPFTVDFALQFNF